MKIRNGFVSNSSSSSYVVIIPIEWTPKSEDILHIIENESLDIINTADVYKEIDKLKKKEHMTYISTDIGRILESLIPKKFIVMSFCSGPDDGKFLSLNINKVKGLI